MKLRIISLFVGLVYALLALPGLLEHQHGASDDQHGGHHDNTQCPACLWKATAATDSPIVLLVPAASPCPATIRLPVAVVRPPCFFALATASRAPPEALV